MILTLVQSDPDFGLFPKYVLIWSVGLTDCNFSCNKSEMHDRCINIEQITSINTLREAQIIIKVILQPFAYDEMTVLSKHSIHSVTAHIRYSSCGNDCR
jgi:hypothetical protein